MIALYIAGHLIRQGLLYFIRTPSDEMVLFYFLTEGEEKAMETFLSKELYSL